MSPQSKRFKALSDRLEALKVKDGEYTERLRRIREMQDDTPEPESQETPSPDEDTRPQRQRDCDALIDAIHALGANVDYAALDMGNLGPPMQIVALLQVLITKGIVTDEEVSAVKWELMHGVLAHFLHAMEERAAQAAAEEAQRPKPSPFLARATQAEIHMLRRRHD